MGCGQHGQRSAALPVAHAAHSPYGDFPARGWGHFRLANGVIFDCQSSD